MRKLITKDVPAFCRVVKKLGIKEEFKRIAQDADTVGDVWSKGYELIWSVFDLATEAAGEGVLYEFLAGPFQMPAEAVGELPLSELFDGLNYIADDPSLIPFFKLAAKLMK